MPPLCLTTRERLYIACGSSKAHFRTRPVSTDVSVKLKEWQIIPKNYIQPYSPTGCGKIHLVLDLIERECSKHFDYIIIICQTLRWNKTYHSKDWIKNDDKVWLIAPKDKLYQWIEKLSQLIARSETLFIIDDIIADEDLDKKRHFLLELAISSRHCDRYSWLLR